MHTHKHTHMHARTHTHTHTRALFSTVMEIMNATSMSDIISDAKF